MANPFGACEMAAGYAKSRPPVHRRVLERAWNRLGRSTPFRCALDVGCGAGVSTRALEGIAERRVGIEPNESMLQWAPATSPGADFLAGTAETLPVRDGAFDLITAAGSLNYVELERFFAEAARVLAPGGVLAVYDFSPGRSFPNGPGLDDWFSRFLQRCPQPVAEARALDPGILAKLAGGFREAASELFEFAIPLTRQFYLAYMMTETNVAAAVQNGASPEEIRSWLRETLDEVWPGGEREVLFRGYYSCLITGT